MADLHHLLAIYVHAHQTGNAVPPHIDADARAALAAEPPAPAEPSDFQTLQGIALDMVESLRPVVIPEILGVLRRAIKQAPLPAPAADGAARLRQCPTHGQQLANAWACPECLRELREELARLKAPAADGEREELAQWLDEEAKRCAAQFHDRITRAAALLRQPAPAPVPGWQPINTAPQDGTEILASDYDAIEIVSWDAWETGSGWIDRNGQRLFPAWWQPLQDHPPIPQPPQCGEVA